MQRDYYGVPLPPYAPVQQQGNTDILSKLKQLQAIQAFQQWYNQQMANQPRIDTRSQDQRYLNSAQYQLDQMRGYPSMF